MKARIHVLVSGRVQGVFFRDHTRRWATSLELAGWVKNLRDGRVEAVAEGEKENLQAFIVQLEQGPPASSVEEVSVTWEDWQNAFSGFRILWS